MSVFFTFFIMLWGMTYICVALLRWFALEFIYNNPGVMWSGAAINFIVATILLAVASVFGYLFTRPFDKILRDLKSEGRSSATKEEIEVCLKSYKKIMNLVLAANALGFFFGQIIVVILGIKSGANEFIPSRVFFVIAQALGFGGVSAITTIKVIDYLLASKREFLGIRSTAEFTKARTASISSSIGLVFFIAVYFIAMNMMTVPYGIILQQEKGIFTGSLMSAYLYKGTICFILSIVLASIPFITVLAGLSRRIKTTSKLLNSIAYNGDLAARINITMTDDFGVLISDINTMIEKLSSMIKDFKSGSDVVNQSAGLLSSTAKQAQKALENLAKSLGQIDENSRRQDKMVYATGKSVQTLTDCIRALEAAGITGKEVNAIKEQVYSLRELLQGLVTASKTTISTVGDSLQAADNVKKSILVVDNSASGNKDTAERVREHVEKFNV